MSLADGDYITVQDKIVAAINADTGSGGLRESGDPPDFTPPIKCIMLKIFVTL